MLMPRLSCQECCGMNGCGNTFCSNHRRYIPPKDRDTSALDAAQRRAAARIAYRYYQELDKKTGKPPKKHPKRR